MYVQLTITPSCKHLCTSIDKDTAGTAASKAQETRREDHDLRSTSCLGMSLMRQLDAYHQV